MWSSIKTKYLVFFYKVPATREASAHYGIYLNRVICYKHRIAKVARLVIEKDYFIVRVLILITLMVGFLYYLGKL